jgi:hypothetical protein
MISEGIVKAKYLLASDGTEINRLIFQFHYFFLKKKWENSWLVVRKRPSEMEINHPYKKRELPLVIYYDF